MTVVLGEMDAPVSSSLTVGDSLWPTQATPGDSGRSEEIGGDPRRRFSVTSVLFRPMREVNRQQGNTRRFVQNLNKSLVTGVLAGKTLTFYLNVYHAGTLIPSMMSVWRSPVLGDRRRPAGLAK